MSNVKYYAYQYNMTGWKVQPVVERIGQCSKPDQMRSILEEYDVSVARCCIFIPVLWSNKRKKKNVFRRQIELQQKESSARLEYSNMSACSWSAFEKRGDRTGWRARWNLHLRDARRMYSMCRRCQTVKRLWDKPGISMSIASYILHPNFSKDLVQRKSSFSTRLRLTVVTFSFVIFFLFLLILSR